MLKITKLLKILVFGKNKSNNNIIGFNIDDDSEKPTNKPKIVKIKKKP